MDEERIKASVAHFIRNPYWREYYMDAPSKACRRYIALEFYYSDIAHPFEEFDEFKSEQAVLEETFTRKDWAHLYKFSGHNPWRSYCKKKMDSFPREIGVK